MQILQSFLLAFLLLSAPLQAQNTKQFVVATDVAIQYVQGEMRFCELEYLRGVTCGWPQKLFGKTRFAARDWWRVETYVQARTGLNEFTLLGVEPTADGRGIIIYFSR